MSELDTLLQDFIPLAKTILPFILGVGFFHCFLRLSMRILRGDAYFYISKEKPEENPEEKPEENPEEKLEEKFGTFDIPEKQTDFIQLN